MICKSCNAELDENTQVCPVCGVSLTEEQTAPETVTEEISETEVLSAETEENGVEPTQNELDYDYEVEPEKPKKKVLPVILGVLASVLALGVLAVVLLAALGVELKIPENDITRKSMYTVSEVEAEKKGDVVVAKVGNKTLTNAELQIYYRMQVLDFLNRYNSYLSQIGFDYAQPLSSQPCYFDDSITWEQYFIDAAIESWSFGQALCLDAEANGFTLDPEVEAEINKVPESLEEEAKNGQYESADAMVKALLGPGCTVEDYVNYVRIDTTASVYYSKLYGEMNPTDEDVESYFTENEVSLSEQGVTKDCGLVSSVRHILVCPKAEEGTESTTFTEQQWADCLATAEKILQEWKDGDATEESFAALVSVYTEDPGSVSTGGLYEEINPYSSYVENFLNWSVDMARQPGDTGIVQTEYGYHIMYFVEGRPYWKDAAKNLLMNELIENMRNGIQNTYPVTVTYKKIALSEINIG